MTQAQPAAGGARVTIPQAVVVNDLAGLLGVTPVDVIKELMKNGVMATINQVVDFDTAAVVAADLAALRGYAEGRFAADGADAPAAEGSAA